MAPLALLSLVGACEVGAGETSALGGIFADGGAQSSSPVPPGSTLSLLDDQDGTLSLVHGQRASLAVALRDSNGDPVVRSFVRFALDGDAGGSSLQNVEVRTDDDGVAAFGLTAGSVDSEFRVRASASGVAPLYVDVTVSMSETRKLTVALSYDGVREVDAIVLRAWAGLDCDDLALGLPSDEPFAQTEAPGDAMTAELSLARTPQALTLQVTALGPSANVVATYCGPLGTQVGASFEAEDRDSVKVGLEDTALRLSGSYPLVAELDVEASAERLAAALEQSLEVTASDGTLPDATRLLNAIQDTLRAAGDTDAAEGIGTQRDSLAAALEQALDDDARGLTVAIASLADMVRLRAAHLSVNAQLSASGTAPLALDYMPMQLSAVAEGQPAIALRFGTDYGVAAVPGTLGADFDTTFSTLRIDALRLELGLGQYGDALLHAMADAPEGSERETLLADAGCDTVASWAAGEDALSACDAGCLADACALALDDMLEDTRMQLAALNIQHGAVALRGTLPIYDLTGNGVAESVQTAAVVGSWGRAETASEPDAVTGTVGQVPLAAP